MYLRFQEIRGTTNPRGHNAPPFIKGVTNLRGTIVPIVNLRIGIQLGNIEYTEFTVVIILNLASRGGRCGGR